MLIKDIMTSRVVTVALDDSLRSIREIFDRVKFHHVLVVYKGVLQGVISDRDVLRHLSPFLDTPSEHNRDLALLRKPAHQLMTRKPVTAAPETPVREAARIFVHEHLSCLPVVDAENRVVGIVTWRDILRGELEE